MDEWQGVPESNRRFKVLETCVQPSHLPDLVSTGNQTAAVASYLARKDAEKDSQMMMAKGTMLCLLVGLEFVMMLGSAHAAQRVKVDCWKRLRDGDIHVDTTKHPELNSGFKVLSYKANRKTDEWSYGSCVVVARP